MHQVHPLREILHNEVHARPHDRLHAPLALTHMAFVETDGGQAREHLNTLLAARHLPQVSDGASHISVDLGGIHLRWEKHTEFHTVTFWRELSDGDLGFDTATLPQLPVQWSDGLPGQRLVGLHVLVLPRVSGEVSPLVRRCLDEDSLVGAEVMDSQLTLFTDFRIHADGFGRWVIEVDASMHPRRLGRAIQRVLEIETYRMMAMRGLPAAREVGGSLGTAERELADVAGEIRHAGKQNEPALLQRLTHLAAQVESLYARTHARFSASAAYFELLQRRITELREERVVGLQTVGEFMDRRLSPAMQTCAWAARRQQALSERISRASNLLRTRVEIEQQQSSQALLDAMNKRQEAQLLLQSAVEGLSVAAITYYGVGLLGYLTKGLKAAGLPVSPDVAMAVGVPVIALSVWWGIRRLHAKVMASVH